MTETEYELLQAKFRQKLNSRVYLSGKQAEAYKDGVKACMSILSSHYHQEAYPRMKYTPAQTREDG